MFSAASFFTLDSFAHRDIFPADAPVWEGLKQLKTYVADMVTTLPRHGVFKDATPLPATLILHNDEIRPADNCSIRFADTTKGQLKVVENGRELRGASVLMAGAVLMGDQISIGQGSLVESGALIKGPTIIGHQTEVRQGAYLRGNCLVGDRCVVGHTTEVKHSILLNDAKAGHFAYLGDSILGTAANLGAGTKFANLRFLSGTIRVRTPDGPVDTGLRKFGAILGDGAQTGCNSVTNPGTLMGREAVLMPNTTAKNGFHPAGTVIR
ncbi:MAG: hypothetical protein CSA34_04710 [Desulfobulbus propionicus]|nr:MAG: hypothetical protein CSA34_04710 [Desulfobulbus propionicus]